MWGFTVNDWVRDDTGAVTGVYITCDNGDGHYMTMEEYVNFTKTRNERENCEKEG